MKLIKPLFSLATFVLFLSQPISAHEGHDHGTPGVMKAPHGGIAQGGSNIDIELVQNTDSILIYGLKEDSSTIAPTDFQVSGTMEFPKKKAEVLTFNAKADHYSAKISFTSAEGKSMGHRAKVVLQMTAKGKPADSFTFQIEPQN